MRRAVARVLLVLAAMVASAVPASAGNVERHFMVSCASTVTAIVAENRNRLGLILVNNGASTIYIGSGNPSPLTTVNGIPIAGGASWNTNGLGEYFGPMSCIVASGTVEMRVQELAK